MWPSPATIPRGGPEAANAPVASDNIGAAEALKPVLCWFLALILLLGVASTSSGATFFFEDTPYLSSADIPAGLYAGGSPTVLEDFEDGTLDFGITVSGGRAIPPGRVDSVDADDGLIDGSGTDGIAWFTEGGTGPAELVFTLPDLPTAAGIVWTDGDEDHITFFEAFGPGMVSLGVLGPFDLGDAFNTGETAEDRFFGVSDPGGILAIRVANTNASGGLEVDHVQFGLMVPEPTTFSLLALGLATLALGARREPASVLCKALGDPPRGRCASWRSAALDGRPGRRLTRRCS